MPGCAARLGLSVDIFLSATAEDRRKSERQREKDHGYQLTQRTESIWFCGVENDKSE